MTPESKLTMQNNINSKADPSVYGVRAIYLPLACNKTRGRLYHLQNDGWRIVHLV